MIRRLRIRHRRLFVVLALLLPATAAAGLLGRQSFPVMPAAAPLPLAGDTRVLGFGSLRVAASRAGSRLVLRPVDDPRAPDVVVIWSQGARQDGVVLGALAGRQPREFTLPGPGGRLFLYSLGHHELLGAAELPWD